MAVSEKGSLQSFQTRLPPPPPPHWSNGKAAQGARFEHSSGESHCPDVLHPLEPQTHELEDFHVQSTNLGKRACWPEWVADLLPASPETVALSCQSCSSCSTCGNANWSSKERPLTISVEVLSLVVLEHGFTVLPPPRETAILDPRTWFAWRPMVEMAGAGPVLTTLEGRPAASGRQSPQKVGEGHWVGLVFPGSPEGSANVMVSSTGMLRFRILRARYAFGSRDLEEVFKANLDLSHDFVSQGYPERLVRPVYWCSDAGDIRHVGQLHIRIREFGKTARKGQAQKHRVYTAYSPGHAARVVRVPQDYNTLQAAVDALLPASPGDGRVIVSAGIHECGTLYIRKPLTLEGCGDDSSIIEGNLIVEAGGEAAEIRKLQLRGSLAVRAGSPLVTGCTVFESGRKAPAAGLARSVIVGGINVSGARVRPRVEGNTVRAGVGPGILVHEGAAGIYCKNTVVGNEASGFEVRDLGTNPTVEGNKLVENMHNGLYVHNNAGGTFRNNDVHRNLRYGIIVSGDGSGSMPAVTGNRVHENEQGGILIMGPVQNSTFDNEELGPPRPPQQVSSQRPPPQVSSQRPPTQEYHQTKYGRRG